MEEAFAGPRVRPTVGHGQPRRMGSSNHLSKDLAAVWRQGSGKRGKACQAVGPTGAKAQRCELVVWARKASSLVWLEARLGEGVDKSSSWRDKQGPCVNQLHPVFQKVSSRYRRTWVWIPVQPCTSCVTMGDVLELL